MSLVEHGHDRFKRTLASNAKGSSRGAVMVSVPVKVIDPKGASPFMS